MNSLKELIGWNPNHLEEVNETYLQHLWWTVKTAGWLGIVIIVGLIHGLIPALLADVPDRLVSPWVTRFLARRERTGQAVKRPLEK